MNLACKDFRWNTTLQLWEIDKDPQATDEYHVHWYDWLRGADFYWTPRTLFKPGDTVTPPREAINGHRYRCTIGGRTHSTPPTWPLTGTTTVVDGGVTWARIGLEDRIASQDFSAETGLTIDSESIDPTETVTRAKVSSGIEGTSYMVTSSITTDAGLTENQRFLVHVKQS